MSENNNTSRMFTVKTALTDYFQGTIGETKLRESIRKGELPHIRIGAKIILREDALNSWMEEQEKQSVQKIDRPFVVLKGSG